MQKRSGNIVSYTMAEMDAMHARGATTLRAGYRPTAKNDQVREFWDRLGLELVSVDPDGQRSYRADLATFRVPAAAHIEVDHAV